MSLPADDIDRVKELKQDGWNDCAISRWTGIGRGTVRNILCRPISVIETDSRLSTRQLNDLIGSMK